MTFAQARDGAFRGKDVQPVPMQAFRHCVYPKQPSEPCFRYGCPDLL